MKQITKLICILLTLALLLPMAGIPAKAEEDIAVNEKTYRIWFDEEAPQTMLGFEEWSLPIGNGYMGLNVFGGVSTELISVTENSLFNPYADSYPTTPNGEERCKSNNGGLGLLAKTYIDFGHSNVSNYQRDLLLDTAVASVSYDADGVHYSREYFSTYPDRVSVMRLTASESGALSFTLRPIAPYVNDYLNTPGDGMGKTGKTVASGDTVIVSGTMDWYDINYEGMYKVIPQGGTMVATNDQNGENGKITVTGADSAIILLAVGTNYHMEPESFASGNTGIKMDANEYPHHKVLSYIEAAAQKSYDQLLEAHLADYKQFYDRANLDLGGKYLENVTTDQLLANYKSGESVPYLEELLFQYGRYLLIASSREGCLPANLQGIWNFGDTAAWSGGYWHNINVQMNYWPAFNTNLAELFQSYVDFNETFRATAQKNADTYLKNVGSETMAAAGTGQNGWAVGTNVSPYRAGAPGTTGHSGPGTGAFTSLLFWDYYDFTRDKTLLAEHTYPAVEGMANFLSKTLKEYEGGKWLVASSASPENASSYRTVGTAFDQQMVYENHLVTLRSAEILGYTAEDHPLLATLAEQIDHLDPVNVGYSGQVKEYREENYYSDIGDPKHRHISQLVGLYPGTVINGNSEAWLDAARVTLDLRGDGTTGWSICHRLLAWARLLDGERSYQLIQKLITSRTNTNLWTTHPPFQIDSNFGYTAGVAEMLVQGHAGYIEFLPALPSAWANGSFTGLTTRGAFEVDARWANGQASQFVIQSKAGEECAVKYQNIATAQVVDSKGNPVSFTAEGTDLIRFATVQGETYTITGISPTVKVAAPSALTVTASGNTMNMAWTASSDAVSYNIYRAVNDAATYEQIATGITDTAYTYVSDDISGADRLTLRVTAIGESGRESVGALAYSLPVTAPESVDGQFYGTDLQLEITGSAGSSYKVYENGSLILETPYNVAIVENADSAKTYSVSTVADGRESAAVTAQLFAGDNILLGKPLTLSDNASIYSSKYPLSMAVDGVIETKTSSVKRWAIKDIADPYSVTADLQGTYKLDTFTFWEWLPNDKITRSDNTTLEVLTPEGQWVTVKSGFPLNPGAATEVDMNGVVATQIRMTFANTKAAKSASISEITCSAVPVNSVDKTQLGKLLQNYDSATAGVKLAYITAKAPAQAVLENKDATQTEVDIALRNIQKALTSTNIFKKQTITTDVPAYNNNTAKYGPAFMVDENYSTRYAANDTGPSLTATVTLDGMYHIEAVFVQEYLNKNTLTRGKDVTIEVYDGSQWITVISGASLTSTPDKAGTYPATTALLFDESVTGNQVRFTFVNNENKRISIYELQAYGQKVNTTGVSLSASMLNATAGKPVDLTATGTVSSWHSSDDTVLSVDNSGNLSALSAGTALITVTGSDGSTASCFVTVQNDRTPLINAITAAEAALEGVSGIDKAPVLVIAGKKFVPTAVLAQLQKALAEAQAALPGANSVQTIQAHTQALNMALAQFKEALQTGIMEDNHSHCVCAGTFAHSHTDVQWTAWGDDLAEQTTLPTADGNYYLVDNIVLSADQKVSSGTAVQLCLNGYNVTSTAKNVYSVYSTLSICDCTDQPGTIQGGNTTNGGTVYIGANGHLKLYGGILSQNGSVESGGVLYISGTGKAQIYGGLITGGVTTSYGGNITNYGSLEIHGGTVEKGSSGNGGNICNRGTMTVTGGLIHAPAKGINVLTTSGSTTTITGGTLQGGTSHNIRIWDAGKLTVSGGKILSGSYTGQGSSIYADKGATIAITGGKASDVAVNMIEEVEGSSSNAKNGASLTVCNANIGTLYLTDSNNTYDPEITISGSTVVEKLISKNVIVSFAQLLEGASVTYREPAEGTVFGTADSTSYIYSDNSLIPVLDGSCLKWAKPTVLAIADGKETYYASVQTAFDSQCDYVKLLADVTENVTIDHAVYLDLNGHTLTGNVDGQGALFGMDSATDNYTTDTMGRITGTVSCHLETQAKTNVTGQVKQYLAIADNEGYTFHRFYVGITKVSLRPSNTGFGYKARFCGDPTVLALIDSFGFNLQLSGMNHVVTKSLDGSTLDSSKEYSLLLRNFIMDSYSQTPVNTQAFIKLKDGTTITSATSSYSMRDMIEALNARFETLNQAQKDALVSFVASYASIMQDWVIENMK